MAFYSDKRYTSEPLTIEEAKSRALAYLVKQGGLRPGEPCRSSFVANAIWPGHKMSPQGAGLAASRILKALEDEGKARWFHGPGRSAGWRAA